jgi:uncharacterized membrane protein YhaH (DUF805 family)
MNWYLEVLKKYAVFQGRARRKEYWSYCLLNFLIAFVLAVVQRNLGLLDNHGHGPLVSLYSLAVFIPSLAVTVRRLHDTDKSGWWFLILLIPIVGVIIFFLLLIRDSQPGHNRYGFCPKELAG